MLRQWQCPHEKYELLHLAPILLEATSAVVKSGDIGKRDINQKN